MQQSSSQTRLAARRTPRALLAAFSLGLLATHVHAQDALEPSETEEAPPSLAEPTSEEPLASDEEEQATETPLAEPLSEPSAAQPIEVVVRGQAAPAERLQKSADAVTVVRLDKARQRSADLGEVLSRVPGVLSRRYGGLGSEFRFSINGLDDRAVRVFVDGVPIDRIYAVGLANVPLNLIENVEVYRGVVPLRLGADALGGALNLVTPKRYETMVQASYSIGSFGTHRATLAGRYRHDRTGFVAGVDAFLDHADNDYFIGVDVADERGRLSPARVRRFHDAYSGYGVGGEIGVVDKGWARKLIARAFASEYSKEIQHNIVMKVPYGDAHYGERVIGGLLRYENTFDERYDLDVVGSYSHRATDFVDDGSWVYDWRGNRVRERRTGGETRTRPSDQTLWQHSVFGRANLDARIAPGHTLTASLSPTYTSRTGKERLLPDPTQRDPLTAERDLFKGVLGLGYTLHLLPREKAPPRAEERLPEDYRFENILFAKGYAYRARSEDPLPGNVFRRRDSDVNRLGFGDTLRVALVDDWLLAKASYEYATRLPDADEVFGNGVLISANLELKPEVSHNANLGPQLDLRRTKAGDFWVDLNLVLRDTKNLIVLVGHDQYQTYQNVFGARVLGVESGFKWTAPGKKYLSLDAQVTYTDRRNTSDKGTFGNFKGDRIPNQPSLMTSWGGYLHFRKVFFEGDSLEPFYQGRFVAEYFRAWESVGLRDSKQVIPAQVSHSLGVTYAMRVGDGRLYGTLDVQNVTDAALFDSFGAQRPGRGYYFKLTGDIR